MPSAHCSSCTCNNAPQHQARRNYITFSTVFQIIGALAAIIFGVWAPLAYQAAKIANVEAVVANINAKGAGQLSIIDFCLTNELWKDRAICQKALADSENLISSMVMVTCGSYPYPSSTYTPIHTTS
ncbi:uncharacterized protein BDZ99DRAFT_469200 [Mytilinidion resinicola]|uniref:Uncharacterized protein n=1 Tax=Mytilinidion resinicola TaxID=574789 RepID=A0A6A6Y0L4_9PEZI|nr:uncharacterized protein BDZ99DRAFT_469200 [Mytilinidion resinicola]KAF2802189.1 hypothetical protein BDZ99DRAFT_469200 [Mytilinidion resinicola]